MATYRLQLSSELDFTYAKKVVTYIAGLGFDTLYLSPVLQARSDSGHGYDGVNPQRLDPKFGSRQDFLALHEHARQQGLTVLLDIVPNHLAVSRENPWWLDTLSWGQASPFARVFAIDWQAGGEESGVVKLPFLGRSFSAALGAGEITLRLAHGRLWMSYYDALYPLTPLSYLYVVQQLLRTSFGADAPPAFSLPLQSFLDSLAVALQDALQGLWTQDEGVSPVAGSDRAAQASALFGRLAAPARTALRESLWELWQQAQATLSAALAEEFDTALQKLLGVAGRGAGDEDAPLTVLHQQQFYRLLPWREGEGQINYRRFFDISELVGVHVEDPVVFEWTHEFLADLLKLPAVAGVRVDHIDGLQQPTRYLSDLHRFMMQVEGRESSNVPLLYIEKILGANETLPAEWPVSGTTGYDFLQQLNALYVEPRGFEQLEEAYRSRCQIFATREEMLWSAKDWVLDHFFKAEWQRLEAKIGAHLLAAFGPPEEAEATSQLAPFFRALTLGLPFYRSYLEALPASRREVERLQRQIARHTPPQSSTAWRAAGRWWRARLDDLLHAHADEQQAGQLLAFFLDWQQLTGALTAKGYEDTFLYRYLPLSSLNEVGCSPWLSEDARASFHRFNRHTRHKLALNMNATSSHDCKRSEDVRARIHVISEYPSQWGHLLAVWQELNARHKSTYKGQQYPDARSEELIYQSLLGSWPLAPAKADAHYCQRLQAYFVKASRERKEQTEWRQVEAEVEAAGQRFIAEILGDEEFLASFLPFQAKLAYWGMWNALNQTVLKCLSPGHPDFYQGTESWHLRLVDPDNRESPDFARLHLQHQQLMSLCRERSGTQIQEELHQDWSSGLIKLFVTCRLLELRREFRDLLAEGDYQALRVHGQRSQHTVAFQWVAEGRRPLVVVTSRWLGAALGSRLPDPQPTAAGAAQLYDAHSVWLDTSLQLPLPQAKWCDLLAQPLALPGSEQKANKVFSGSVLLSELLGRWPMAVLSPHV